MSPIEIMCFFFISLVVVKAIRDSVEYWKEPEEEYVPRKTARVSRIPSGPAKVTAVGRSTHTARRGKAA
ncbi:hypothetical protein SAMN02910456_01832 [Ruminococcaceae bacterium YRB3002]|nr:hypothetical protein SAMN02910456_01832 [Ruminococcaceae bacterium YRB3002]